MIWRIKRRVIAFRGSLNDVNAVDLIRVPGQTRRTGALRMSSPSGEAELFYEKGSLVDVRSGALEGMEALVEIVGWKKGEFEFALNVDAEKTTILVDLQRALLDALRIREERDAAAQSTPLAPEVIAGIAPEEAPQAAPEPAPDPAPPAAAVEAPHGEEDGQALEIEKWLAAPPPPEPPAADDEDHLPETAEPPAGEPLQLAEERARLAEDRAAEAEQQALTAFERAEAAERRAALAEERALAAPAQSAEAEPPQAEPAPAPPHNPDPVLSAYLRDLLPSAPFLLHLSVCDSAGRVLAEAGAREAHEGFDAVRASLERLRADYPRAPIRRLIIEDPAGTAVLLALSGSLSFLVFADATASLGSISVAAGKLALRLPRFEAEAAPAATSHYSQEGDSRQCQS